MTVLFVSDIHLCPTRPGVTDLFVEFLRVEATKCRELYILGDLFETWVGDDAHSEMNNAVKAELKKLTEKNIPVYLMHGNRDFLLGKQFARETGCTLISDPHPIDISGQTVLLMHGDTLCTEDPKYLKYRKRVRHPLVQYLFTRLPLRSRENIAKKARGKSKKHQSRAAENIMDVSMSEVSKIMKKHNAHTLVHGHTHRPAIHNFKLGSELASRIVLSDWDEKGGFLSFTKDGKSRLVDFEI